MNEKETIRLLNKLSKIVPSVEKAFKKSSPPGREYQDIKGIYYPMFSSYARCRSLYGAILVLLNKHMAEEALILTRSLLEESLRLHHILNSPQERRLEYLAYWIKKSNDDLKACLLEIKDESEEMNERVQSRLQEVTVSLKQLMKKEKINKPRKLPNITNLCKNYLKDDYFVSLIGHNMTHGYALSQIFRTVNTKVDNTQFVAVHTQMQNALLQFIGLSISMKSILRAQIATAEILGWSNTDECREILNKINEITQE